jgi:hypothetical protein
MRCSASSPTCRSGETARNLRRGEAPVCRQKSIATDTGEWRGAALRYEAHSDYRAPIWFYKDCIVWRASTAQRVETVALISSVTDHDTHGIVAFSAPLLVVGRGGIGTLQRN